MTLNILIPPGLLPATSQQLVASIAFEAANFPFEPEKTLIGRLIVWKSGFKKKQQQLDLSGDGELKTRRSSLDANFNIPVDK